MDLLWIAVFGGLLVETLLYYAAPGVLARLAFVPIARTSWATVSARVPSPPPAPLPEDDRAIGRWGGRTGWLRLKCHWARYDGHWQAVARIDTRRRGAKVALEAKMWPFGVFGFAVGLAVLALFIAPEIGLEASGVTLGLMALGVGMSVYLGRHQLEAPVIRALDDVARRMQ